MDKVLKRSYFVVFLSIPGWMSVFLTNFLFSIFFEVHFIFDPFKLIYFPAFIIIVNFIFIKFAVLNIFFKSRKKSFFYTRLLFITINGLWATYICVNQPDVYNGFSILFTFLLGISFLNRLLGFRGTCLGSVMFFLIFIFFLNISNIPFGKDEKLLCYFFGYSAIIFGVRNESTIRQMKKEKELIKIQESYAKDLEVEVEEKTNNVNNLIENLDQGFMIIDRHGIIQKGATKASKDLFGIDPANKKIEELLKLKIVEKSNFNKWLSHAFEGLVPFKDLVGLAPKSFKNEEGRVIALDYKPIYHNIKNKEIDRIIFIANDVTEKVKFEMEAEIEKEKAKSLTSILERPLEFVDLMSDSDETIIYYLKNLSESKPEDLFRSFHTLKARFSSFRINEISQKIHDLENVLNEIEGAWNRNNISTVHGIIDEIKVSRSSFLKENRRLMELASSSVNSLETGGNTKSLIGKIQSLYEYVNREFVLKEVSTLFKQFVLPTKELAKQQDKLIDIKIKESEIYLDPQCYKGFFPELLHIFRNSIDHGVESREERVSKNKSEVANLEISFLSKSKKSFKIIIKDDGKGIDPNSIKAIASKKEELSYLDLKNLSEEEAISLIFEPNFSSKEEVTNISGRGVGMDVVKREVEKLGGAISVSSKVDEGTTFVIKLPVLK